MYIVTHGATVGGYTTLTTTFASTTVRVRYIIYSYGVLILFCAGETLFDSFDESFRNAVFAVCAAPAMGTRHETRDTWSI